MIDYSPTRYVAISKEGLISVWSTSFELARTIDISTTIEDDTIYARRRTKLWVTDAVCMHNVHKLAVASTNRDINFFDMSTPTYKALFHLCGKHFVIIIVLGIHTSDKALSNTNNYNRKG